MSGNINGHYYSKFFWRDWRNDLALKRCSREARGFWMDLLCIMHECSPVGHLAINGEPMSLKDIALYADIDQRSARRLLEVLEKSGVFSRTTNGTIFCRRMVRDAEASETGRQNAEKRWGNDRLQPNGDANPNPNANSKESELKKERVPPNPHAVGEGTPHSGDPAENQRNVNDFSNRCKQASPRAMGTNPRATGANPRANGTKPPLKRNYQQEIADLHAKTLAILRAAGHQVPDGWDIVGVAS
jgi:hypothetical protein